MTPSSARNLTESTVRMVQKWIKDNIESELAKIRTERGDAKVTTEPPKDYFIYEEALTYRCPAIYTIADEVDLLKSAGPNAIMANVLMKVSVVIEDQKQDSLSIKAWRYQDALFGVLDQAQIESEDKQIKLFVIVQRARFSPTFTREKDPRDVKNAFRKEVVLECDVRHMEQP